MRRAVAGLLAALLLGAPAAAQTSGVGFAGALGPSQQGPGGTGLKPWLTAGAGVDLDFQNGLYYPGNAPTAWTVSRGSTDSETDLNGNLTTAATNQLATNSAGAAVWEARTNSIPCNVPASCGTVAGSPGTLPTGWNDFTSPLNGISRQVVGTGTEQGIPYIDINYSGTARSESVV